MASFHHIRRGEKLKYKKILCQALEKRWKRFELHVERNICIKSERAAKENLVGESSAEFIF